MTDPAIALEDTQESEQREAGPKNRMKRSIFDVPVNVSISLGSVRLKVREILELETNAIFPLDARIEDPVELIVDGRLIAYGELKETEDGGIAVAIVEIPDGDSLSEE